MTDNPDIPRYTLIIPDIQLDFAFLGGDPLAHTVRCKWNNDLFIVVLEIPSESSKSTPDEEPCALRQLLHELEENGEGVKVLYWYFWMLVEHLKN